MLDTFSLKASLYQNLVPKGYSNLTFQELLDKDVPGAKVDSDPSDCFERVSGLKEFLVAMFNSFPAAQQDAVMNQLGYERDKV